MEQFLNHSDFYLLRTPVGSVNELLALNKNLSPTILASTMREVFSQPFYQEAIYVASPELHQELQKWLENKLSNEKEIDKLITSLYKYYVRMCTRCTPYGLFAGSAMGEISENSTEIAFEEYQKYHKHSRLDMNYVAELTEYIGKLPNVKKHLKYFVNNSLYRTGDSFRYAQFRLKNKNRSYYLTSIKATAFLEKILKIAQNGAIVADFANAIVDDKINETMATNYVNKLINSQILVSELEPTVTGDEFFKVLMKTIQKLPDTQEIVDNLQNIERLLSKQDHDIHHYEGIKMAIDENFKTTSSKDLVQTDLFYNTPVNNLNNELIQKIISQLQCLLKLRVKFVSPNLDAFQKAFYERYEDKEVPLTIALDSENGIGYGKLLKGRGANLPLVDGLRFESKPNDNQKVRWNKVSKMVLAKYEQSLTDNLETIKLSREDIDKLSAADKSDTWGVPNSMYALGTLLAENVEKLDAGDFKFLLKAFGGPSAGNLLARFCHGNEILSQKVTECLAEEQVANEDTILAEIVHLPESRIGNILMRPTFRAYEIPYLGNASVEKDKQIPIDDLMVSVQFGKIRLRSKRLNKFVIPRLTSAHNYARGLSVYKFLCELQFQNINMSMYWNWGILQEKSYLPRVEFENIILSPAQWTLKKQEGFQKRSDDNFIETTIQELTNIHRLPKQCLIVEGDNELLIDLGTAIGRKILFEKLSQADIFLHEFLSTPENCFIGDEPNKFCNEIILPITKTVTKKTKFNPSILSAQTQFTRNFSIGSEWLYVKIYGGLKSLDKILGEVINPLANELLTNDYIEKWFFIRYEDPDKHLRLRFNHSHRPDFWSIVLRKLNELLQPYLDEGLVYKLQVDTYQREIERYGQDTMSLSESVFWNDSEAVAGFVSLIEGDAGEKYRWLFGLRGVDMLLNDFGYDLSRKAQLMKYLKNGFFNEFGGGDKLRYQLNDKFRSEREAIEKILDASHDTEEFQPAIDLLNQRSIKNELINVELQRLQLELNSIKTHDDLLNSYIHMFMNRLFLSNNRSHELVIYYFLDRYYESRLARQKSKGNNTKIKNEELLLLN